MTPVSLRIARPTADLETTARLYERGLGWTRLGEFRNHEGFSGIMLGPTDAAYHLELTHEAGAPPEPPPSHENLLVLYYDDADTWSLRCAAMKAAGFIEVAPHNPYWQRDARCFVDPDGYRVVLHAGRWPASSGHRRP